MADIQGTKCHTVGKEIVKWEKIKCRIIQLPENLGIRYAVLPGDPARAERAAGYLKDAKLLTFNREYKSYSGFWNGVPVLVMSTGMGGPSMAIAVEELQKIGVEAAVRIGSCGALQPEVRVGDLVMVEAAVRDEGTSLGYAPLSYPAVADHRLLTACEESAKEAGCRFHTGIARSHDCLYRMTIRLFMRNGQRKACWRLTWKLRSLLCWQDTWYEDSIYFKCSGSLQGQCS